MKTLLFVCTGNTCRSPMAAALAKKALGDAQDWRVVSAGISALNGQSVSPHSVTALRSLGLDISQHRAQMLTGRLVQEADYIFGLTRGHVEGIASLYPEAAEKLFVLREFEDDISDLDLDIHDPIGGPLEGYVECRDQILKAVDAAVRFIREGASGRPGLSVAFGCDHAGFPLKSSLVPALVGWGIKVSDEGTHGTDSVDYPDHAQAVARKVASGQADLGLLVCSTGVGVSIAANKVPGVRAALVHTVEGAILARQHNDANVLCLGARFVSPGLALQIIEAFVQTPFEGGRHERRVNKIEPDMSQSLATVDPKIADIIRHERSRQLENIELIASENFTSPAVMEVQGSVLTNKYAEGYPGKRWYGGCEYVDEAE